MIPSVSALTNIKILLGGSLKPNPFSRLKSLKKLWLSEIGERVKLDDLAPLAGLASLQWLDVSHTQVTDLTPLAGLVSLQRLEVSRTQVTDLSPLAGLASLQWLEVSQTQVAHLSPLAGLASLQNA